MGFASSRQSPWLRPLLAALGLLGAACEIPRDAAGTTERVEAGELRAGAVHNPPWVIAEGGEPRGIEPDLVRGFAASLGSRVRWVVGSEETLIRALEERELDVVVAGLPASSPHGKRVGFIAPYVELDDPHVMAVPPGESRFAARLEAHLAGERDDVLRALREARARPGVAAVGDPMGSPP